MKIERGGKTYLVDDYIAMIEDKLAKEEVHRDAVRPPKQITISVKVNFEGDQESARGLGSIMACAAVEAANQTTGAVVVESGWMIQRPPTGRRNPRRAAVDAAVRRGKAGKRGNPRENAERQVQR